MSGRTRAPQPQPQPEGNTPISNPPELQPGGNAAACGDWEASGNLIGHPPVRDRHHPPNCGIVEDEAVYNARISAARATASAQQARADSFLDGDGNVIDQRYWFAQVYTFVSEEEIREITGGTFYYPSYVAQCVRYFDQIYQDNMDAWDNGGTVEDHWRTAFQTAVDSEGVNWQDILGNGGGAAAGMGLGSAVGGPVGSIVGAFAGYFMGDAMAEMYTAIQNLVVSMQAHIRYDLPRAEAWVFNSSYAGMDGANISNFQPDFMAMTPVFERAAGRLNPIIAEKTGVPVTLMPRMLQDMAMTYWFDADMATERADTWARTEELVNRGLAGNGPYTDDGTTLQGNATASDNMSMLSGLSPDLRPSMDSSAAGYDDNQVRDLNATTDLARRSTTDRIRMLRALMRGATFNDDEATILDILDASTRAGDLVTVVDGANVWEMAYAVDGAEFRTLRNVLLERYYPHTSASTAFAILTRCLDGETAEWEEEMVADILTSRSDGRTLITQLGAHYSGGGFTEGLNKLEWQLDGADEDRIADAFGTSGTFW